MNRYIIFLMTILMPLMAMSQNGYGDYDSSDPTDPSFDDEELVTLKAAPSVSAGYFNATPADMHVDSTYTFCAYPRSGYVFLQWEKGDEVLSYSPTLRYMITDSKPVTLQAVFRYNPANPGNPHPNNWDSETGELIIDDFKTGSLVTSLNSAIQGYGVSTNDIRQITIAGRIDSYDFMAFSNKGYEACELLDFSRTTGLDTIPANAYTKDTNLKSIFLPETVTRIEKYAFSSCTSLDLVYCYSLIPPFIVDSTSFANISSSAVLYVPLSSQNDYQNSEWAKYFSAINAIPDDHVGSIQLNLPEKNIGRYHNMSIELINQVNGQVQKYIVTDRWQYTFNNLVRKTQWKAYLKNQAGLILSEIDSITVNPVEYSAMQGWQVQVYEFQNIRPLFDIDVHVFAGSKDVTDDLVFTWSTDAGKTLLSRQTSVSGLLKGMEVTLSINLSDDLSLNYANVSDTTYTVTNDFLQSIRIDLQAHPLVALNGVLVSKDNRLPISGAVVAVNQILNNKYAKSYTATTNADGRFAVGIYSAPTTVTCSARNFISRTDTYSNINSDPQTLELSPIQGARIALKLNFKQIDGSTVDFPYPEKVNFSVKKDAKAMDFNLQQKEDGSYEAVLFDEIKAGQQLTLTASSQEGRFKDTNTTVTIQDNKAEAQFSIKQYGGINATYRSTENNDVIALVFQNSKLKYTGEFNTDTRLLQLKEIPDGVYNVVAMKNSEFFGTVQNYNSLKNLGLKLNRDYIEKSVTVVSGKMATCTLGTIPLLDEASLQYTDPANTSFSLNNGIVTPGNYLTVSAKVLFKQANRRYVKNPRLVIDLPESIDEHEGYYVNNSLLIDGKIDYTNHEVTSNQLIINLDKASAKTKDIKFCVIPSTSGEYVMNAYVMFDYDDVKVAQPIGSASYKVEAMTINVPSVSATKQIVVSGTSVGHSSIDIFCDGMLIAQTTSLANGVWATLCTLPVDSTSNQELIKNIHAVITTAQGVRIVTTTQQCLYCVKAIDVNVVHMYHNNPEMHRVYDLTFNFKSPSYYSQKYIYYIYNKVFSFKLDFNDNTPDNLANVYIGVKTGVGYTDIPAHYSNGHWEATGNFGNYYNNSLVPRNVRVSYDQLVGGKFYRHYVVYSGCLDASFAIDPSGYVYEGVASNRVEGATATIYYKEDETDMYGAVTSKEYLWNAEEYAQKNPLFTDSEGMYRWDVPQGLWQVRIEKDGYETACSEWLPVPPPQLDINIPIIQNSVPEVVSANAYQTNDGNDFVDVTFSKYMKPETFTTSAVVLKTIKNTQETTLLGIHFEFLDKEVSYAGNSDTLASKVRIYSGVELGDYDEVHLVLSSGIKSYAGKPLQAYNQRLDVKKKIQQIVVADNINIHADGTTKEIVVSAIPADASMGKQLVVTSGSDLFLLVSGNDADYATADTLTLDANGEATIYLKGQMQGATNITIAIQETDMTAESAVNILDESYFVQTETPTFTTNNTELYSGQTVGIRCATESATIYYTTDGTEPNPVTANVYSASNPVVITSNTVIKAIAVGAEADNISGVATGSYNIKQRSAQISLTNGWNWISHNLTDGDAVITSLKANPTVKRIIGQQDELICDSKYGWLGNISDASAANGLKVQIDGTATIALNGNESNPDATIISLSKGWNWIGYPVSQTQSLAEAMQYALEDETIEEGDQIVSLTGGYAQFEDGQWQGELSLLSPLSAYMYKSVSDKSMTFTNNKVSSVKQHDKGGAVDFLVKPWTVNLHAYSDVMGLTLTVDGCSQSADGLFIGAFVDDECRGLAQLHDGKAYLSIHGQGGETIRFRVAYTIQDYVLNADQSLTFLSDIIGTPSAPYLITIGGMTSIQPIISTIQGKQPMYNTSGQQVSSSYKGIVIRDGHKYLNR